MDSIPLAVLPRLLHLRPVLQLHSRPVINIPARERRCMTLPRVSEPFVRIAGRTRVTGRVEGVLGGAFGRAKGVQADLAADGTDDGLGRQALEEGA